MSPQQPPPFQILSPWSATSKLARAQKRAKVAPRDAAGFAQHLKIQTYVFSWSKPLQTLQHCFLSNFWWFNKTTNSSKYLCLFQFGSQRTRKDLSFSHEPVLALKTRNSPAFLASLKQIVLFTTLYSTFADSIPRLLPSFTLLIRVITVVEFKKLIQFTQIFNYS